jgi:uncharacterized protein (DUF362 family)
MLDNLSLAHRLAPHQVTIFRDLATAKNQNYLTQDPDTNFPEYQFATGGRPNPVCAALRQLFVAMKLDWQNCGSASWNPLGEVLRPGDRVVVKPNLVYHEHYERGELNWVVTDPRLVRAVCDYVLLAIGDEGELVVGDAPLQSADWDLLLSRTGIDKLPAFYAKRGYRVQLRDFRTMHTVNVRGLKCKPRKLPGDPLGYRAVNLGNQSLHAGREWQRYRVTNYNPAAMRSHHNAETHEYLVSGSILAADVVINLPKLKTHRKSGLTGPLKNMVGVNGCKDWLPHHSRGSAETGGDEYSRESAWKKVSSWILEKEEASGIATSRLAWNLLRRCLWKSALPLASDHSWEGSWHGNDTLWRTILDLNRIVLYADRNGTMLPSPQRRVFCIADAMIAGEGNGPMSPEPVPMGVLMAANHPLAGEMASIALARWPSGVLRAIQGAWGLTHFPLEFSVTSEPEILCVERRGAGLASIPLQEASRYLRPPVGWVVDQAAVEPAEKGAQEALHYAP